MESTMTISAFQPLASVILSSNVTRNTEGQLELQLLKKESGHVSLETLPLPKENVTLYTEKGYLDVSQEKSSKSWST